MHLSSQIHMANFSCCNLISAQFVIKVRDKPHCRILEALLKVHMSEECTKYS